MKLTVITSTFNAASSSGEAELKRCLKSVARIGLEHEHVVEDGGSSDTTIDIIKNLGIQSVRIYQEKDSGIYNALNKALARATGEWIYIIGADDYVVRPEIVEAAIRQAEGSNVGMIAAPVMTREDGASILPLRAKKFFTYIPYPHQGLLMRRELIMRLGGFDEQYRVIADYDLEMRALLLGTSVLEVNEPFAYYNTGGFSNNCDDRIIIETRLMLSNLLGLRECEYENVRPKAVLPLRIVKRYIFNKSIIVRKAARFQFKRWLANCVGLINDKGIFSFRRR